MGGYLFSPMLAEGEVVTNSYDTFISTLGSTFTASALSGILVALVSAVAGLIVFWWAVRKATRVFARAFEKGKLRI